MVCSWDDGAAEDMRLYDLCIKYGIKDVTFYIPADWQEFNWSLNREPLDVIDLIKISESFKIGSHTITHPMLTRIPLSKAKTEIEDSKVFLEYLIGRHINSFCYPRGYANDEIREIVRKNYKTARNTLLTGIKPDPDPIWQGSSVHVGGKRRPEYEGTTWLKEGLKLLKEAVRTPGSVYSIFGHSWELTREDGWYDLETLLKEVSRVK